jgi:Tol biopolymer transport system component
LTLAEVPPKRVAYPGQSLDITEVARPIPIRLTTDIANDWYPVWSPGGNDLVFVSDRRNGGMFSKSAARPDAAESLINNIAPEDWSRDGKWIAGYRDNTLWVSNPAPGSVPVPILPKSNAPSDGIRFSPDSRWIAYVSNESGVPHVYVRPFNGAAIAGTAIPISREGGDFPNWNPLGGELFFVSGDLTMWSVNTRDLGRAPLSEPVRLFRLCESSSGSTVPLRLASFINPYDTLDGNRFLVNCTIQPPNHFTILMNWKFKG